MRAAGQDAATAEVTYASCTAGSWGSPQTVTGAWGTAVTSLSPALAVYDGDL
jgi:hypothetical protein